MPRLLSCAVLIIFFASSSAVLAIEYRFTNIADSTTPAPLGTFESFGVPAISSNIVAFRGDYNDSDTFGSGIFTGTGQSLTTIAKSGDTAPSGVFHGSFSDPAISGSLVAFRGSYAETAGVFVGSGGLLSSIAQPGDSAPPGTLSNEFGNPAIDNGSVAVRNGYRNDKKGIVSGSGGPLTPIVTTGDAAPVGTFGFNLPFGHPAISNGKVAFGAGYLCGSGRVCNAIFVGSGGALTTMVKTGDPAPSGSFNAFGNPAISGEVVAFLASFPGGGGVFTATDGEVTTVAKTGDVTPLGTLTAFEADAVSIAGDKVAFLGHYAVGQEGIFTSSNGMINSVVNFGDTLFGSTVVGLGFGRFGLDMGQSGNLAFGYGLADGRFGVALASPIPEPCTIALSGLGVLVAGCTASGRRKAR